MRAAIAIALAAVATPFASTSAAEPAQTAATQRRIHVITQDFVHVGCGDCGDLFGGGLLGWEDRRRVESVARQFAFLEAELPHVDVRALIHEAFCRELAGSTDPRCSQVVVFDRPKEREKGSIEVGPEGALLVTFAIEYLQGLGADGFRLIAGFGAPVPDKTTEPFLHLWYMTMPPKSVRASPLVPADQATAKQKVARDYWWAGSPSRIETELRRGIADIASMARIAVPRMGPDTSSDDRKAWYQSLPAVSELKAAGKTDCRGAMCDFVYIGVSEDRYWWAQHATALIIMSTPLVPLR